MVVLCQALWHSGRPLVFVHGWWTVELHHSQMWWPSRVLEFYQGWNFCFSSFKLQMQWSLFWTTRHSTLGKSLVDNITALGRNQTPSWYAQWDCQLRTVHASLFRASLMWFASCSPFSTLGFVFLLFWGVVASLVVKGYGWSLRSETALYDL